MTSFANGAPWENCVGNIPWQDMDAAMEGRDRVVGVRCDYGAATQINLYPPTHDDALLRVACHHFTIRPGLARKAALLDSILSAARSGWLTGVTYDRWDGFLCGVVEEAGVPALPCRVGFSELSPAFRSLEGLIHTQRLHHGGHPGLRDMAAAVKVVSTEAGERMPYPYHGACIDGIFALTMALSFVKLIDEPTLPVMTNAPMDGVAALTRTPIFRGYRGKRL
jgi:hypothetical protein